MGQVGFARSMRWGSLTGPLYLTASLVRSASSLLSDQSTVLGRLQAVQAAEQTRNSHTCRAQMTWSRASRCCPPVAGAQVRILPVTV